MDSQRFKYTIVWVMVMIQLLIAQTASSSRLESANEYFSEKVEEGVPFSDLAIFLSSLILFIGLLALINVFMRHRS